jgi:hypothetical protein
MKLLVSAKFKGADLWPLKSGDFAFNISTFLG